MVSPFVLSTLSLILNLFSTLNDVDVVGVIALFRSVLDELKTRFGSHPRPFLQSRYGLLDHPFRPNLFSIFTCRGSGEDERE